MKRYPSRVPLAVPYWNSETYRAASRAIFLGRIVGGPEINQLKSLILSRIEAADALLCGSGSLALEFALASCGVGRGDEVVIPSFCCTAVVPPVLKLGAVPVFADVGDELNLTASTVDDALTSKTKAVIVPHLFGNPADIASIEEIARAKNICVIDDAAQALGATINGRPVGGFGDAGIISFGGGKICSGIGGGVAVSRNNEMFHDIYLRLPSTLSELRRFVSMFVLHRWRRWTFPLDTVKPEPDTPPLPYGRESMANLSAAIALSLVRKLDDNITARRERVRAYSDLLRGESRVTHIRHRPGSACLAQVIRVTPKNSGDDPAARIIEALRTAGYEVQGSYVPIHLLSPYERWARSTLLNAETVWGNLIELPCEPDVNLDDVERIVAIVQQTIA